eukprot:9561742-Prorocentrum_lima.AAC.1
MTSSLVGSEMCIRDRKEVQKIQPKEAKSLRLCCSGEMYQERKVCSVETVSYTHLTLPTICSV